MGSTCASVHVKWRGGMAEAGAAISRAHTKMGYQRVKKLPAAGGKRVILAARAGERQFSVFDSENADLDSGDLKELALAASKALKSLAVFTSLYDSDSYEFVVFFNGRQIDYLTTDMDADCGALKRLSDKARVTQWSRMTARVLTAEQIKAAMETRSAFAESTLGALCTVLGVESGWTQAHYQDFADEPSRVVAELLFKKKEIVAPVAGSGEILLRQYYDKDNSRKLLVYPACWPMPVDREEMLTWLMISEGEGFRGGSLEVEVAGPEGLEFTRCFVNGAKFHNGQIVGGYGLDKDTPLEVAQAYLESKRFSLIPVGEWREGRILYRAEYPNLWVPAMTPQRTTQILLVLQLSLRAVVTAEWDVKVKLRPGAEGGPEFVMPGAGVAAVGMGWVPVVSGLNQKIAYEIRDVGEAPVPDGMLDLLMKRSYDPRRSQMNDVEARAQYRDHYAQARARSYADWLYDLRYAQKRVLDLRGMEYPAVASNVAILKDEGAVLEVCRRYVEARVAALGETGVDIRIQAERFMTESFHVGKVKRTLPAGTVLGDKAWAKFFDEPGEYQALICELMPSGAEIPIGGVGFYFNLRDLRMRGAKSADDAIAYLEQMMARTLGKMRGREIAPVPVGDAVHVFEWVVNREECFEALGSSISLMQVRLDELAAARAPLQAWHGCACWKPRFDLASDFEGTVYEEMSVLNFFRGVLLDQGFGLKDQRMSAGWCGNVLRMVAPLMWLGAGLMAQIDRAALERVAVVREGDGCCRVEKRPEVEMEDLELALLPILPVESARISMEEGFFFEEKKQKTLDSQAAEQTPRPSG